MNTRAAIVATVVATATALTSTAGSAREDSSGSRPASEAEATDPLLNPEALPEPRRASGAADAAALRQLADRSAAESWGPRGGATWIAASQFTAVANPANPPLNYDVFFFFEGDGRYFAQLDLEAGLQINQIACVHDDTSPTEDVSFSWFRANMDINDGIRSTISLDSVASSGTGGVGFGLLLPPGGAETMSNFDPATLTVRAHYLSVDLAPQTAFAGCMVFWTREVAPAPGSATFSDVPTGHHFFQAIEALVQTGTTAGCGSGKYCPNDPLTRGQMANFLAKALGMGFQY